MNYSLKYPCSIILLFVLQASLAVAEPRSGYDYIKPETREMQDDDFANPGLLAVDHGLELFNRKQSATRKSCADCHGEAGEKLDKQSLARYPVYDAKIKSIISLQKRIRVCQENTSNKSLPINDPDLVALETFVRNLAKGEKVNVKTEGEVAALLEKGRKIYQTRYGLIDMACNQCHEQYIGRRIRGQVISQGMGNGFPAYRLDTGEVTSLNLRIQQCMSLLRAEPFAPDSEEIKLLQLYIMSRSNGLSIETPAVRY